ncbi:uncharacterized protein LOC135932513 [Pelmatolapia mariae]|uniref:uncharacterized protein LOC135932513 n=1 Tax=Pelmatolapia mariae TaxID=158779 RepID=UPI003211D40E
MTENLHRHIAVHFGRNTLQLVREYERESRKLADYRNHLRFNLRCRQSRVVPKSLRLGSTVRGHRADLILRRAQNQLLSERIRQVHFTIDALQSKISQTLQELETLLPSPIVEEVYKFVEKAQRAQHFKGKERQLRKFHTLLSKTLTPQSESTQLIEEHTPEDSQEKWVKNFSDRNLTEPEKNVLAKGLNFAIAPQQLPIVDLITATETAIRINKLSQTEAEQIRMKVSATLSSAKVPPSNLTLQEKKAIASLSKDHNITILPADKGRCTVVLNTTDYHAKITTVLSDNNTYEALKRDPTSSYKKKVITSLQDLERDKIIDRLTYHRLYPGDAIPCIYGLPKIHKEVIPLRPIVNSINSATYNISKHLATILAPLVGNTPHHIKNSTDFTDKVQKLTLDPDETMVSFDVVSLFTCIPTTEAVETVRKRLQEDSALEDKTNFTPDQICTLLDLCLTTTYFKYNEGFYRQKHGCAMGSPVSPIVANLYMEEVERKALGSFKGRVPSHWYRYVDDTWVKIKTQEVESFTAHINAVDKNIKFTREDTKDNCLPFLDCAVHIEENGNLNIEVYRKPTHTDQYLLFDSHHPLEHKLGVIRTLHHRAEHVPSKPEGKKKEHTHVKEALKTCGYPNWAFIKSAEMHRKEDQTPAREDKKDRRNNIVIPYVAGVSEKLRRVFSKHDIPVYFRPSNTLRQKLVHPKDKTPKHKLNNVVYVVQCSEECPDLYIGETKQPLHKHMAQHRRATSTGQDSAVHLHLKDKGHSFEDANIHILDREDRWFERGVKEAIYVHCERPSLNRGGGLRHQLSAIYNPYYVVV